MKTLKIALSSLLLSLSFTVSNANAALLHFTGNLTNFDDYVITQFTLSSAGSVDAWTDSFGQNGSFDPIVAFWNTDGSFITQNDDNSSYSGLQGVFDSGQTYSFAAGTYYFTMSVYDNFATGDNLFGSNPFTGNTCGSCTSGSNTFYSLWIDGVDSATTTTASEVPEPASLALLGLGLAGLGFSRRKKA